MVSSLVLLKKAKRIFPGRFLSNYFTSLVILWILVQLNLMVNFLIFYSKSLSLQAFCSLMKSIDIYYFRFKNILVHLVSILASTCMSLRTGNFCHPRVIHGIWFRTLRNLLLVKFLFNMLKKSIISRWAYFVAKLENLLVCERVKEKFHLFSWKPVFLIKTVQDVWVLTAEFF